MWNLYQSVEPTQLLAFFFLEKKDIQGLIKYNLINTLMIMI